MTLVTGATGFLGSHVARALVERGDDVRVTVRRTSSAEALEGLDVHRVVADVTDRRQVRRALDGVDRVFHVAGSTSLRLSEDDLFRVNVRGTQVVLEACLRAGVERVVYTSSVAALGPAPRGKTVDETQVFRAGGLDIPYVTSKHAAEAEALRVAARGLPVVIVSPAHVLGRGDHRRSSTDVVRRFLLGRIPAYVEGAINVVDVRDVAHGHVLADEAGRPGERYILGNRNYTWDRLFAELARLSGVAPPPMRLPADVALRLVQAAGYVPRAQLPFTAAEVRAAAQWWTYRSTKARRELGWTTGAHEDTVEETVAFWRERLGDRVQTDARPMRWRVAGGYVRLLERIGTRAAL
jgi:dihydroflavonol-4-reductase